MSWNVLITARAFAVAGQSAREFLQKEGCQVLMEQFGPFKQEQLLPRLEGVDATLCSPDAYNQTVLQSPQAAILKAISRWGVGYDSIDIAEATHQGIVVPYTPGMLNEQWA